MPQAHGKHFTDDEGAAKVRNKNSNGEGSLYRATVTRNGKTTTRWEAVRTLPGGRRIKRTGATRQRALDRLAGAMAAQNRGPSDIKTLSDLMTRYLDRVAAPKVAPTTLDTYRKMAAAVVAIGGTWFVKDIRKEHAEQLVDDLAATYGHHFTRACRRLTRRAMGDAIDLGLIAANPFDRVEAPKAPGAAPRRTLSVDEQRALVTEAITGEYRHGLAVAILFTAGMRVSEVLGLRWEDVDYDAETIHVQRGLVYQDRVGMVVRPTKTRSTVGYRHLPGFLNAPLRKLRARQAEEHLALGPYLDRAGDGFLFVGTQHQLVNRQTITKELHRVCRAVGIDPTGLATHSGRRTVITNLYVDGAVSEDIAAAVGHSDPATTRGYVQDLGDRPTETAKRMARLLAGPDA